MSIQHPARSLANNLMWTRGGTVWGLWTLNAQAYGYRTRKEKALVRNLHTALFRALPGESMLLSVSSAIDPAAVMEKMIQGVNLELHPDWATEVEATYDTLGELGLGKRVYVLAIPLTKVSTTDKARQIAMAAMDNARDVLNLPRPSVNEAEVAHYLKEAARAVNDIPKQFDPTPMTAAQMVWLMLHNLQRGLFADLAFPTTAADDTTAKLLLPRGSSALPTPVLDEGGRADFDTAKERIASNPLRRRFVKVTQADSPDDDMPASYQSLLVFSDMPSGGTVFPGAEFLGRVDECGVDVDWVIRLVVRSSQEVQRKNQQALRNINAQYTQREGHGAGVSALDEAAVDLAEYTAVLEADKLEVEAQATVILAVGAPTADEVNEHATTVSNYFNDAGYKLAKPLGSQIDLWWAMTPGVPMTRIVRDYAQITTSASLAAAIPLASSELGDTKGSAVAINITTGLNGIVMHDLAGAAVRNISGSFAVCGELGSGKSVLLKKLAGDTIDRGGQVIVPDRTQVGEWANWAKAVPGAVIVDAGNPEHSMDPLRVWGPARGYEIASSFLTRLLDLAPTSPLGTVLADVLDPGYLMAQNLSGLGDVLAHLEAGVVNLKHVSEKETSELARLMRVFSRTGFGRVVFDSTLPAVSTSAPLIVIRTHTLELPSKDELENPQLFKQMGVPKIFGRAFYALIAGLAREVCFADISRLGLFVIDEAHHVTISPEGERYATEFLRDGRKHQAAIGLGSHDPEADFGSETLRGLIPYRYVLRLSDKILARKAIRWMEADENDEGLLEAVTKHTSPASADGVPMHRRGEGYMRDPAGNIGRIKVLAPSDPTRAKAAGTTPPVITAA